MFSPGLAPDRPRDLLSLSSSGQRQDVFDAFEYKTREDVVNRTPLRAKAHQEGAASS
jgi:hypothetical protein